MEQDRLHFGTDLSFFIDERNTSCSYCPQGLGIICYHLCWAVHLQGRWETPEKQPPAFLPHAALPCTALLTGFLSGIGFQGHLCLILPAWPRRQSHCSQVVWCQHLQWGQESAKQWKSFGLRTREILGIFLEQDRLHFGTDLSFFGGKELQMFLLPSGPRDHLLPFVLGCPSARQMGNT